MSLGTKAIAVIRLQWFNSLFRFVVSGLRRYDLGYNLEIPDLLWLQLAISQTVNLSCKCSCSVARHHWWANYSFKVFVGASLSEPHTSVTALQDACVCLLAVIYRKFNWTNGYEDICRYTYISNLHTCFKIQICDRQRAMPGGVFPLGLIP